MLLTILSGRRKKTVQVECRSVEQISITDAIPASGKIKPVVEVKLSPDVSGEIVELFYKEGDYVEEGAVLLRIRQDLYLSQVEQAEASLNSLKADYQRQLAETQQAELNFARSEYLFKEKAVSQAEYESAKAELEIMRERTKVALFSIKSGNAQLKETLENLKKTSVSAPMSGIISRLNVEKGERVVGTSQMAGTEMLRIADFSRMEVIVDVGENDVVRLHPGDTALVEVDAYPGQKFEGIVTQIANSAKNIGVSLEQVTNFEVRIEIASLSSTLLPGMSATVSIITHSAGLCKAVPLQSVFGREGKSYVWVIDERSCVHLREIVTGIQDFSFIEVCNGLELEERIVCGPLSSIGSLEEGQKVKLN